MDDRLDEDRYEQQQLERSDIDQRQHAHLMELIAHLGHERDAAPPEHRRAWRGDLAVARNALYEFRHGPKSELGDLSDRMPMGYEAKLHAAHRALNARAEEVGDHQHGSPYTRAHLAARSTEELPDLARRGEVVVRLFAAADKQTGPLHGRPDSRAIAHSAHADLTAYVHGESRWREREID